MTATLTQTAQVVGPLVVLIVVLVVALWWESP